MRSSTAIEALPTADFYEYETLLSEAERHKLK